jgi:hypothetical protein
MIQELALSQLYVEKVVATDAAARAREMLGAIKGELARRFAALANGAPGTKRTDEDGFRITCDEKKEVTWQSDRLLALAMSMPLDEALSIFKIEVSVPERTYQNLPADLRARIDNARTVEIKPPSFNIEPLKE